MAIPRICAIQRSTGRENLRKFNFDNEIELTVEIDEVGEAKSLEGAICVLMPSVRRVEGVSRLEKSFSPLPAGERGRG